MTKKSKRILIAEDEKPLARALTLKLEKQGYAVTVAPDGVTLRNQLDEFTFDLVLMDLMMPQHDGFALLADLKEKKDTTPVVILSNLSQDTDRERAQAAGATEYFVKASTPLSEVVTYINSLLK